MLISLGLNGVIMRARKGQFDCIDKNIITSSLNLYEFFKVSQCFLAKEMWNILEVTHEVTNNVKRARKHALIQESELFRMQDGETIVDMQKRLTLIMNNLIGLGKIYDEEELNIKVLKCLDRSWHPKITAISETTNVTMLSTTTLFGKLREYELDMNKFKEQENGERKASGITLKTAALGEESETNSSEDNEAKTLNLLQENSSNS